MTKQTLPVLLSALVLALLCPADRAVTAAEKAFYPTALPQGIQKTKVRGRYLSSRDGAIMVYVPEGTASLGSDNNDEDEAPLHRVTLSAYFIDQTEVTNGRYKMFLKWWRLAPPAQKKMYSHPDEPLHQDHTPAFWPRGSEPGKKREVVGEESEKVVEKKAPPHDEEPVVGVSWFSAYAYARWAGKSLPSEAQWEKAAATDAKSASVRKYPWGNQAPDFTLLNFSRNVRRPTRVGTYRTGASPAGCLDLAGNVWEWCLDFYHKDFYKSKAGTAPDPVNIFPSPYRVTKGGSYNADALECRSAYRDRSKPKERFSDLGFRCAKAVPRKGSGKGRK